MADAVSTEAWWRLEVKRKNIKQCCLNPVRGHTVEGKILNNNFFGGGENK